MVFIPVCDKYCFVVTDIHGCLDDFRYYLELWLEDISNHIVFTGDLIHNDVFEDDESLCILDMVREYIEYPTFHVLIGNHEWGQIWGDSVFRYNVNQCDDFVRLIEYVFPNDFTDRYLNYKNLLKLFDLCLVTGNGFFMIHSGIHEDYKENILNESVNIYEKYNIEDLTDFDKKVITEILWCRPYEDYMEDSIDEILNFFNCKFMISGHTNYNGCHILGNQLIFDSSHNTNNKYYLKFKLNKEYTNIIDVLKCLHKKREGNKIK